jgi:FkbM family methyltransferase
MSGRITHAIEAEDILLGRLHRELVHRGQDVPGFYVDIGAFDPSHASNTRLLYEAGWSGINIEPNPDQIAAFHAERPRDVTINCGVASIPSRLTYTRFINPALNGFLEQKWIDRHIRMGVAVVNQMEVDCLPAREIMARHLPAGQVVDILNIDVELVELDVLRSWNFERTRPVLVAIELHGPVHNLDATQPIPVYDALAIAETAEARHLIERGYAFFSRLWHTSIFVDQDRMSAAAR